MPTRTKLANKSDVPTGGGIELAVNGRIVALYHVDGEYYALDGICPHAGGPLGKGNLNGNIVTCPWHGWQFDVTTGQHCLNDQIQQAAIPVIIEGEELFAEL